MKPIAILALAGLAAAADYPAFTIPHLATNQPNGDKFGYYWIDFNVTSENGDALSWCFAWWGDNPDQTPVDKWIPCTTEYNGQNYSDTSFKLTQQLQIGDFKFALKQNFTETIDGTTSQTITTTDPYHISNTTAGFPYNCTINPFMNPYNIHASGNCETTAALTIPVTDASPACEFAKTVSLSFPIEVRTEWGDSVYVVGSIPELGDWDLSRAVPLNADHYTSSKMIWTGGDVKVKAGTTFEWKAVQKNRDGSWTWECGENWVASVDEYTCGEQVVGNDPTWMRCGNH